MKWSSLVLLTMGVVIGISVGFLMTSFSASADGTKIPMWLEVVHRLCISVGGLGTFVALLFVVRQFNLLQTQSELMQKNIIASMDSQLYSRLDSFNKFIVEHYQEYELLDNPFKPDETPDAKSKLHHLCDLGFTFYEAIFKLRMRYGLSGTEDWEEWQQNMAHFFSKPYVRGYWRTVAGRYAKSFQGFANDLVAKVEEAGRTRP